MRESSEDISATVIKRYRDAGIRLGPPKTDADIIVRDGHAYTFMLDELYLGRAYEAGLWDVGQMKIDEFTVKRVRGGLYVAPQRPDAALQNPENAENIVAHYNAGNDFFDSFLDLPWRQYSSAIRSPSVRCLEEGQLHKMHVTGSKARLRRDDFVLDVGCGWGGLMRFLAERWGVRAIGTTLSKEQRMHARANKKELPMAVIGCHWQKLPHFIGKGRVNHIVSVGAFEHFGIAHYDDFFRMCVELLADDGTMVLHTIYSRFKSGMHPWLEETIFPGGELPTRKDVEKAFAPYFDAADWYFFGRDYAWTLGEWNRRMNEAKPRLFGERYPERFYRRQDYYQLLSKSLFDLRLITVGQVHLYKKGKVPIDYAPVR